ncbi:isoprenoid biosynthesis glyoxalase ElbB [Candidatus Providencia siddallii]|uniref:Glyoxalase n=1 Tax=Candidatus Providencia siddallii TaxID=1715285 RepID=A0ABM9NP00_9GAMM
MKKIAVILSGCGFLDGSEIHESILTLLALDANKAKSYCFALDELQNTVVNHTNNKQKKQQRNQMEESARISRGEIFSLSTIDANNLDGLIIPGGFGIIRNLCDFEINGSKCKINKNLIKIIKNMHQLKKPLGLMCIAPVIIPKILNIPIKLTIGNDKKIISEIKKMGAIHIECAVDNIIVDEDNLIVTTPAYMLTKSIFEINNGISKLVKKILEMI